MKRMLDLTAAVCGLVLSLPILLPVCLLIWLQDFHSPFYIAPRVGRGGRTFRMVKLRSMVVRADRTGVDSTSTSDPRITRLGRLIRKLKLDEFTQLWNVLFGQMSLVGPRPNVERETRLYSDLEKRLLSVRPGITDLASIVFADEGEILQGQPDPDLAYNQLIRPWKSRLGLFAIDHQSMFFDIYQVFLTLLGALSRRAALALVARALRRRGAGEALRRVALRQAPLIPTPPPGLDQLVTSRAK
jgi:lipopolysaccharide/colanic/teichoic acid biosynthesis glycosyltransferase